jgi:hypothetical protein
MLLVANVMQQIKYLLKLIVVLLGLRAQKVLFTPANYCINDFILIGFYKIVIFILRECFLCMKRSFTPRRTSRQYKPLNAQKHLRARNINNIFSIIDSKN